MSDDSTTLPMTTSGPPRFLTVADLRSAIEDVPGDAVVWLSQEHLDYDDQLARSVRVTTTIQPERMAAWDVVIG